MDVCHSQMQSEEIKTSANDPIITIKEQTKGNALCFKDEFKDNTSYNLYISPLPKRRKAQANWLSRAAGSKDPL